MSPHSKRKQEAVVTDNLSRALDRLCEGLGHEFRDPALLATALTHRSAGSDNNERLEFLGDALLGFIMAEELFRRFPDTDEGRLTRLRAALVKRDTLASVARALAVGECLTLGEGERKSGGWRRDSILANAVEALLGAIYLDAGMAECRATVLRLFGERLAGLSPEAVVKDPKTELQEYLQARHLPLPSYTTLSVEGDPHDQRFTVSCAVSSLPHPITAHGSSRQRAEQAAAREALSAVRGTQRKSR